MHRLRQNHRAIEDIDALDALLLHVVRDYFVNFFANCSSLRSMSINLALPFIAQQLFTAHRYRISLHPPPSVSRLLKSRS